MKPLSPFGFGTGSSRLESTRHNPAIPPAMRSPSAAKAAAWAGRPRFSGLLDGLARTFEQITERWTIGYLAQDMVAIWVPREVVSLYRGMIPYNPKLDPHYHELEGQPFRQFLYKTRMQVQGLNFQNGWEEFLREVETGPGIIAAQSAVYGAMALGFFGKSALVLGRKPLQVFTQTLSHLAAQPEASWLDPALSYESRLQQLKAHWIKHLLASPAYSDLNVALSSGSRYHNVLPRLSGKGHLPQDQALHAFLKQHFPAYPQSKVTFQQAFEAWAEATSRHQVPTLLESVQSQGLRAGWKTWARYHNPNQPVFERLCHWLRDSEWQRLTPADRQLLEQVRERTLANEQLILSLQKFEPVLTSALKRFEHLLAAQPGQSAVKLFQHALANRLQWTLIAKVVFAALATLAGGRAVVWVSAQAQSSKLYPAQRTYQVFDPDATDAQAARAGAVQPVYSQPVSLPFPAAPVPTPVVGAFSLPSFNPGPYGQLPVGAAFWGMSPPTQQEDRR